MRSNPRLTSIEIFGFGAGWDWRPSDAEIVRRLLVFLEDRRAIAYGHYREDVEHVVSSVLEIRKELTRTLQELAANSGAARSVRALRQACVDFLDRTHRGSANEFDQAFVERLGELQLQFVGYVRLLADRYQITVDGPLADLLREADRLEAEQS